MGRPILFGIGSFLRECPVCKAQITAHSRALTAHEMECLGITEIFERENEDGMGNELG